MVTTPETAIRIPSCDFDRAEAIKAVRPNAINEMCAPNTYNEKASGSEELATAHATRPRTNPTTAGNPTPSALDSLRTIAYRTTAAATAANHHHIVPLTCCNDIALADYNRAKHH